MRRAYFLDEESANYDWRCHGGFVCDRCGGHSKSEDQSQRTCLICEDKTRLPRPTKITVTVEA